MNNRLLLSAAASQITQKNRLCNDAVDTTFYYQLGKVRSRGIEVEASGEILPG
jgi:outer membrane receptor for ferric coprogen and ferric-rhodotorulic acid